MELNWKELINKRVHLILKNDYEYNGMILGVEEKYYNTIIKFIDKFSKIIYFTTAEIKFIEVK